MEQQAAAGSPDAVSIPSQYSFPGSYFKKKIKFENFEKSRRKEIKKIGME